MSKVTMPEPVAQQIRYLDSNELSRTYGRWSDWQMFTGKYERMGANQKRSLVTTAQAEAYVAAKVREALEALNNQAQELYESSLKSRLTRDGAADEDELKAIDLWNVESVGMAKAYTNMQKAIRALIPKE